MKQHLEILRNFFALIGFGFVLFVIFKTTLNLGQSFSKFLDLYS